MNFHTSKTFQINGIPYTIHEFALKEASIFESLNDTNNESNIIIKEALVEDINKIIMLIYGYPNRDLFTETSVENVIKYVSVMMYMGLNEKLINESVSQMLNHNEDIMEELIIAFESGLCNYECLKFIINQHKYKRYYLPDQFSKLLERIKKLDCVDFFKISLLTNIIISTSSVVNFDIILGINFNFEKKWHQIKDIIDVDNNNMIKSETLKKYKDFYQRFLQIEPIISIDFDEHTINRIEINYKSVGMIRYTKTTTNGTYGGNFMMSFATHIAKILLGLETL